MRSLMKGIVRRLIGRDLVIEVVSEYVSKSLNRMNDILEADRFLYELGVTIRERIPNNIVDSHISHFVLAFKLGLQGKKFNIED